MALRFEITGDNSNLLNSLDGARAGVDRAAREIEQSGTSIEDMFKRIGQVAGIAFSLEQAKSFIGKVAEVRGYFQDIESSMEVFLGSQQKAAEFTNKLKDYAYYNMFEFADLADASKQMIAYGHDIDTVIPRLDQLSNIARGTNADLAEMVHLYNNAKNLGSVGSQQLASWATKGLVVKDVLKEMGEKCDDTTVTFEQLNMVLDKVTGEGGMFHDLMQNQMQNISAEVGQLQDNLDSMFNEIGEKYQDYITGAIKGAAWLVDNYEKVGKTIISLIATYGVYKTALAVVTATEGWATVAEAAHYQALLHVEKAQKLLNATMLSNPYVLVATAVAALVAVMVNMKSSTERTQEAYDKYMETLQETTEKEKEHAAEIEKLCDIADDESLSTDARRSALVKLEQQYPSIFEKYDTEYEKLANIKKIKQEIAELDGRSSVTNSQNELANLDDEIKKLEDSLNSRKTGNAGKYEDSFIGTHTQILQDRLKAYKKRRDELNKEVKKNKDDTYLSNLTGISNTDLQRQINERRSLIAKMDVNGSKYGKTQVGGVLGTYTKDELQGQMQILQSELNRRAQILEDGSKNFVTEAQKAYNNEKKALGALRSLADPDKRKGSTLVIGGVKVSDMTAEQYAEAVEKQAEAVSKAEKKLKNLTDKASTKEDNKAEKVATEQQGLKDMQDDLSLERIRSAQDLEKKVADARIAAMADGAEKVRLQQERQDKEELDALERQKEDTIRKYIDEEERLFDQQEKIKKTQNEKYKVQKFDKSTVDTSAIAQQYDELIRLTKGKQVQEAQKESLESMRDFLKEYGSFYLQKFAITEKYEEKIRKAQSVGERLSLEKQRDEELANVEYAAIGQKIDWYSVFDNLGSVMKGPMEELLNELKDYIKTPQFQSLQPEQKQTVVNAMSNIRQAIGTTGDLDFRALAKAVREYQTALQEQRETEEKYKPVLDETTKKLEEAQQRLDKIIKTDPTNTAAIKQAQNEVEGFQIKLAEAGGELNKADERVKSSGQNMATTAKDVINPVSEITTLLQQSGIPRLGELFAAFDKLKGGIDGLKALKKLDGEKIEKAGGELADKMADAGKKVADGAGKSVSVIAKSLSTGGLIAQIISAVLSILDILKDGIGAVVSDILDTILNAVAGIIKNIVTGEFYTQVWGSLRDGLGNILNALTAGGFNALFDVHGNERDVAATIERLTRRNELLQQSVEDLTSEMEKYHGTLAIQKSKDAKEMQEETNENYKKIAQAQAGYHSAHHSFDYYWNGFSQEEIDRLSEQIGRRWSGDIWDLSPEEMKALRSNVDMWEKIVNTGEGGYGERVAEKLDDYIEQAGKLDDIKEALYESLTTTTEDDVFDDFLDSLYDLANGSEDVFDDIAESWQKMVNKMVINNLVGQKFQQNLNSWYEQLAKLNEQMTNGEITEDTYREQLDALKGLYDGFVESAQRDIETLRSQGIIAATDGSEYTQEASSKGFQSMGQDTGEELNGRFTALQISGDVIAQQAVQIYGQMIAMTAIQTSSNNCLIEIRNMMITANGYLEDTAKYSKKMYLEFGEKLDSMISNTKNL